MTGSRLVGFLFAVFAASSVFAGSEQTKAAGSVRADLGSGRWYVMHDPEAGAWRGGPRPLVVMLHGGMGGPWQVERTSGWNEEAKRRGWLVAYPAGVGIFEGKDAGRTWNAGRCCGAAQRRGADDSGFLADVIAHAQEKWGVEQAGSAPAVLVTGMSNGGMMTHRFACERPGLLIAAAPVSGSFESDCKPVGGVFVLAVHGELDKSVPLEGGAPTGGLQAALGQRVDRSSFSHGIEAWARANGCKGDVPRQWKAGSWFAKGCSAGGVSAVVIPAHGHVWPYGQTRRDEPFNAGWSAPSRIGDFFAEVLRGGPK